MLGTGRLLSRATDAARACVVAWREGGTAEVGRVVTDALYWRFHPRVRRWAAELPRQQRIDTEFDLRFGTDTAGEVALGEVGIVGDDVERGHGRYRPVWTHVFRAALAELHVDLSRFTFVDYGSGKGKALLLASDYPFREVVGVEFARPLHDIAVRNVAGYRSETQRCAAVHSECADATTFVPPSGPLVCFFFNPFDEATLGSVLERLSDAAKREPREIFVVYTNMRDVREHETAFRRRPGLSAVASGSQYLVYRVHA